MSVLVPSHVARSLTYTSSLLTEPEFIALIIFVFAVIIYSFVVYFEILHILIDNGI